MASVEPCWKLIATKVLDPVSQYQADRRNLLLSQGRRTNSTPSRASLRKMVECAFWTSLRTEEGRFPKFSMVYASKNECRNRLEFVHPKPFRAEVIAPLAFSLSHDNSRLGVAKAAGTDNLQVWGVIQEYPTDCIEIRVLRPGRIMIQANGERLGLVDKDMGHCLLTRRWDGRLHGPLLFMLAKMLGEGIASHRGELSSRILGTMLLLLTEAMHDHEHGGAIVVVPKRVTSWRDSIAFAHGLKQFDQLSGHLERLTDEAARTGSAPTDLQGFFTGERWKINPELLRLVGTIGAFTTVDGATVLNNSLEVKGFGAKIQVKPDPHWRRPCVRQVQDFLSDPAWNPKTQQCEFSSLGGTRHQSAAYLVAKNPGLAVIVASQDGGLSIFAWEHELKRLVITRRVETLLE
jgi:hypothetical protein